MTMRKEDIDKLTARIGSILKEMMPPGSDYKFTLVVGEREDDGIKLALGTNASYGVAAAISEMGAHEFRQQEQQQDMSDIAHVLRLILSAIAKDKTAEDDAPTDTTKH